MVFTLGHLLSGNGHQPVSTTCWSDPAEKLVCHADRRTVIIVAQQWVPLCQCSAQYGTVTMVQTQSSTGRSGHGAGHTRPSCQSQTRSPVCSGCGEGFGAAFGVGAAEVGGEPVHGQGALRVQLRRSPYSSVRPGVQGCRRPSPCPCCQVYDAVHNN
jgi:hypothetical protein